MLRLQATNSRFLLRSLRMPLAPSPRLGMALLKSPTPSGLRGTRFSSTSPQPSSFQPPPPPDLSANPSLAQRLKHLIKTYGWYALGVYASVSTLTFGGSFLVVNLLGAEYVTHAVATVKAAAAGVFRPIHLAESSEVDAEIQQVAAHAESGKEGVYAMLVLAYGAYKLLMPVRIGFTAAFTPRLVRWLRAKGWAGGEGTRRAVHDIKEKLRDGNKSNHD